MSDVIEGLGRAVVGVFAGIPLAIAQQFSGLIGGRSRVQVSREGPKIEDNRVLVSQEGFVIPRVYGTARIAGNMIAGYPIQQNPVVTTEEVGGGGKGGGGGGGTVITTTTYKPTKDFAVLFCEGPVLGVQRYWGSGILLFNNSITAAYGTYTASLSGIHNIRFYNGSETQTADPFIVSANGSSPAYLGYSYGFADRFDIQHWGGLPNLEFEIVSQGTTGPVAVNLDTPSQFNPAINACIGNDGTMVLVDFNGGTFERRAFTSSPADLSNPTIIRTPTGYDPFQSQPARLADGTTVWLDQSLLYVQRTPGGKWAKFGIAEGVVPWPDKNNTIWGACRTSSAPLEHHVIAVNGGAPDPIFYKRFRIAATPQSLYYDVESDTIYISYSNVSPSEVVIRQHALGGRVIRTIASGARSMCIAGDGSLWYVDVSSTGDVWRVPAGSTTPTKIRTESSNNYTNIKKVTRDWQSGDVLFCNIDVYRYAADGTLKYSLTPPSNTGGGCVAAVTNPLFPRYIILINNQTSGTPATQNIWGLRDSVVTEGAYSIAQFFSAECLLAGLSAQEIDVSSITGNLNGYAVNRRMQARAVIEEVMKAYLIDCVEIDGKLKFVFRNQSVSVVIPEDDLGAQIGQSESPLQIEIAQEAELPREVVVNYINSEKDYQPGAEYARRTFGSTRANLDVEIALAFTPTQARQLAEAMLAETYTTRFKYSFQTTNKYTKYVPTNVIQVVYKGTTYSMRIISKTENDGFIRWECLGFDPLDYSQNVPGSPAVETSSVSTVGPTVPYFIDGRLYRDLDDDYGNYLVVNGAFSGWQGANLWKSTDDGASFSDTGTAFYRNGIVGNAKTKLGNYTGGYLFDEFNTVQVALFSGTLSSVSETQALAGENAFLIGSEEVRAKNAVLQGDGTYILSGLLRGCRGTKEFQNRHYSGETVIKIDSSTYKTLNSGLSDLNVDRVYKVPTFGQALISTGAITFRSKSNRLKPNPPVQIGGGRANNQDITITWLRSGRVGIEWADYSDHILDETTENYEVDIFAGNALAITAITQDTDALITTSGAHGLAVNDYIYIHNVSGMTEFNERTFQVTSVPTTTTLTVGEYSTFHTAYAGAGSLLKRKPSGTIATTTPTASYTASQQVTDYGSNQSTIRVAIYQISNRVGRGFPGTGVI